MSNQTNQIYEFGAFQIDVEEGLLRRDGEVLPLAPKVLHMLLVLVESGGRVVSKEELMARVWPDSFVEEANISRNIFTLRKTLGEGCIETIPKRGYRFAAPISQPSLDDAEALTIEERSKSRIIIQEEQDLEERGEPRHVLESGVASPLRRRPLKALVGRRQLAVAGIALVGFAGIAYYLRTRGQPAPAPIRSIAVLPFKPIEANSRDESLELGMADTLITKLSTIRQILVRPTSSVRKFGDLASDPLAAGRELMVESVLSGNIQRSGDRIRVTVRLTRVADGASIWSDQFDERYTDIFALQDSVSGKVASALSLTLTGEEQKLLARHYTENAEAYNLYLQGRFYWNKFTEAGLRKSIEYYNHALENDRQYALAYSGLSDAYSVLGLNYVSPSETSPLAKDYALKALELDETLAEAHKSMGAIKFFNDWDWPGAEKHLRRAMEIKPNYAEPHQLYASYLGVMGRVEEALVEMRRAHELDPLSVVINRDLGRTYLFAHQYDDAFRHSQELVKLDPSSARDHWLLARLYEATGSHDKAMDEYLKADTLSNNAEAVDALRGAWAASGWKGYWEKQLEIAKDRAKHRYVLAEEIAEIYTRLGQKDSAVVWVQKACEVHSINPYQLKLDPIYDPLRSDPRFVATMQREGLQQ